MDYRMDHRMDYRMDRRMEHRMDHRMDDAYDGSYMKVICGSRAGLRGPYDNMGTGRNVYTC